MQPQHSLGRLEVIQAVWKRINRPSNKTITHLRALSDDSRGEIADLRARIIHDNGVIARLTSQNEQLLDLVQQLNADLAEARKQPPIGLFSRFNRKV
jgi:hypothetical protein